MSGDDPFRRSAIDSLIRDIAALTGGVFEAWGYRLMRFLVPEVVWDHRGTTSIGAPVGYTVDSSGDHARFVAQFSSVSGYFDGVKPVSDLDSTFAKHPKVGQIWLLAAVQATPSERSKTDNAIKDWVDAHPQIEVKSLDGRQIATYIVDNLDSDELVDALRGQLSSLSRIAEENALSHSLPKRGKYVVRLDLEDFCKRILNHKRYVILAGLSGVGKSDLAVRLAQGLDVDSRIWLDATHFQGPEELKSASLARRGFQHNVDFLLRKRRCVVVLDNLRSPWSDEVFRGLVGPGSYLVVTSQAGGERGDVILVQNANKRVARSILEVDAASSCPDEVFEDIWATTKGHPLLLRLLGKLAEEHDGDWSVPRKCCETIVSHGEDDNNEKVCRRVLKQHLPALHDELAFFVWCDSPVVDAALLNACVSPMAPRNLAKRHLLAAATDRALRLHDIVFQSAKVEVGLDTAVIDRYREKLDRFIRDEADEDDLVFDRCARRHNHLLLRELSRRKGPEVLYALARARVDPTVLDAFGDLVAEAKKMTSGGGSVIAVRAMIEAIEATYSLMAESRSKREAQDRLRILMEAFDALESMNLSPALTLDVWHHRAKMLARLEQWEEAEKNFRVVLDENPEMHGAKLQLVRLLARDRKDEAIALAKELVDPTVLSVAPRVKIAAWVEIARMRPEFAAEHITEILATLHGASQGDVAAACGLVAQVGSYLAYRKPDAALALFEEIKDEEPVFSSDAERLDWARAHQVAAKALLDNAPAASAVALLQRARATYESVRSARMSGFHMTQHAETLLLLNDALAAKQVLERVRDEERTEFWWHRYAQAELRMGELDGALVAIEEALRLLKDQKYRAAFLEVRHDIRHCKGDAGALDDLGEAIVVAGNPKYKNQLERKLAALQK